MKNSERFWDRLSKKFDKRVTKKFGQNYQWIITNCKKYFTPQSIVLDFACGTGLITFQICNDVKEVYAIDFSSKMVELARDKIIENNINNVFVSQMTIDDNRLKECSFDQILLFNVLHLLDDSNIIFHKVYELLKPGGLVISSTECLGERKSLVNILLYLLCKMRIIPHLHFFRISELKKLNTNNCFEIIEIKKFNQSCFIVAKKK